MIRTTTARRERPSWVRGVSARLLVAALLATALSAVAPAAPAQAISGSDFNPGAIISDTLFYDGDAMSEAEIQQFLLAKGSGLAYMTFTVASRPRSISQDTGNVKCEAFQGVKGFLRRPSSTEHSRRAGSAPR
jgi:hypothetical protein